MPGMLVIDTMQITVLAGNALNRKCTIKRDSECSCHGNVDQSETPLSAVSFEEGLLGSRGTHMHVSEVK